jgi:hypothetical protein
MFLSLTIPDTRQRDVLLQVTIPAEGVQGLRGQPVARRIDVCGAREYLKTFNLEDIQPVVLSYNYYINIQSTQLSMYLLMQHVLTFKKSCQAQILVIKSTKDT